MIFTSSLPRLKAFLGDFCSKSSDLTCCLLFIIPFILPAARRSVSGASRSLLSDSRNAGWLLRWLGSSRAPAAFLAAAQFQLLATAKGAADRLHILVLDSTMHGGQGKNT